MFSRIIPLVAALASIGISPSSSIAADSPIKFSEYVVSWTEKDGLPASVVSAITQDQDGYLWLGTNTGVVRFDGLRFVLLETLFGRKQANHSVYALCAARDGTLWIGYAGAGGVARLRQKQLVNYGREDGLRDGSVHAMLEDHNGTIWVGTDTGLSRFRENRWERIDIDFGLPGRPIYGLYEDSRGQLWVGSSEGIFRRSSENDRFQLFTKALVVRGFTEDRSGMMWVTGSDWAAATFNPVAPTSAPTPVLGAGVDGWQLLLCRHGDMWIATMGQGVWRKSYSKTSESGVIEHITADQGLTHDAVKSVFEDREGNIWIGTYHGLNRLSENRFAPLPAGAERLKSQPLQAVLATNDGSLWVAAADGLYRFLREKIRRYDARDGLPAAAINGLHTHSDGALWVTTASGISRFSQGRFVSVPLPSSLKLRRIRAVTTDRNGALWLCDVEQGIYRIQDNQVTAWSHRPEFDGKVGMFVYADTVGRVWMGFADGTLVVSDQNGLHSYSRREGLIGDFATAIYEDKLGRIWIGTNEGLSRFEKGRFVTLTESNGFAEKYIRAILEDDRGNLWLGVSSGIVRLSPSEFDFAIRDPSHRVQYALYDTSDGLAGFPVFGFPAATVGVDGRFWFVTTRGIATVSPAKFMKPPLPPPIHIENLVADEANFDPGVEQVTLPSHTSRVQIDYTALSFSAPAKVHYRYILEGFDTDWVDAGVRRTALYTNLSPGRHRFRVKATTEGVWTENDALLDFSIEPMFYQTRKFQIASISMLPLAILAIWQFRVRRIRKQFSLVLAERTRMAREIHDTLLQSLVAVTLELEVLATQLGPVSNSTTDSIRRLRMRLEEHLRDARQAINNLRTVTCSNRDFPARLKQAAEQLTAGTLVQFEFVMHGQYRSCSAHVEEQLLRIGQEAVINAIRHGQPSRIRLEVHYEDESVLLRISDDGSGFSPHPPDGHGHWGLVTMRERAEGIGGRLKLRSEPGGGTDIETVVPYA